MSSSPSIHFRPAEREVNDLLLALIDPARSFDDVARAHHTTADALSAWMIRPDIAERLRTHESAVVTRLHLIAAHTLTLALQSVSRVLKDFNARPAPEACAPQCESAHRVPSPSSPRESAYLRSAPKATSADHLAAASAAQTACRAASLLLRLARFTPTPRIPRIPAPAPAPAPAPHTTATSPEHTLPPPAPPQSGNTSAASPPPQRRIPATTSPNIPPRPTRPLTPSIDDLLGTFQTQRTRTAHLLATAGGLPAG